MTKIPANLWRATPLHGLILLGLIAVFVDLFVSFRHLWTRPTASAGNCMYQVFQNDEYLGTFFLSQSEEPSTIAATAGARLTPRASCEKIPCNRAIRIDQGGTTFSVEKIQGWRILAAGKRIDVNLADHGDLESVPGIGARLADQIILVRNSKGGFQSVDDLQQVPGIGPKRLEQITTYLEVGASPGAESRR